MAHLIAQREPDDERGPRWMPALLAALAALVVFAITLRGTYVYDDAYFEPGSPDADARYFHPLQWHQFWTQAYNPGAVDRLYRPLTSMTFALEYWLHGDRPWIGHAINWLLHAATAAAVAELARRLFGWRTAVVAGVLFAVHPVHVEVVAGLVGRAELLCTLAILSACLLFLHRMTGGRAAAIVGCLAVAVLSKEQGMLLPAILLTLAPFRPRFLAGSSTSDNVEEVDRGAIKGLTAALCLTLAGYIIFRENLLGFAWDRSKISWPDNPLVRSTGADRFLMPLVLLGRYTALLVAPVRLSLDYGGKVIGWTVDWRQPYVYVGIATILVWLVAIVWAWRRQAWAATFCLLALAISYGMAANFPVLIGTIFGERLMYLPSAFFVCAVAALLARLLERRALAGVVFILAIVGAGRSFTYARLWNDPLKLYTTSLAAHPGSLSLHKLTQYAYLRRHDYLAAREVSKHCVAMLPERWESYALCCEADLPLHDYADALAVLNSAEGRCTDMRPIRFWRSDVIEAQANFEKQSRPATTQDAAGADAADTNELSK